MLLKVNYFAVIKGKSLTCRVFIKAEMIIFMRVCGIPHNLFSNDFLNNLMQFFTIRQIQI